VILYFEIHYSKLLVVAYLNLIFYTGFPLIHIFTLLTFLRIYFFDKYFFVKMCQLPKFDLPILIK